MAILFLGANQHDFFSSVHLKIVFIHFFKSSKDGNIIFSVYFKISNTGKLCILLFIRPLHISVTLFKSIATYLFNFTDSSQYRVAQSFNDL